MANPAQLVKSSSTSDVRPSGATFTRSSDSTVTTSRTQPSYSTSSITGTPSPNGSPNTLSLPSSSTSTFQTSPTSPSASGSSTTGSTPSSFRHQSPSLGLSPGAITGIVIAALTLLLCLFLLIRSHRHRVRTRLASESNWALIPSPDSEVQTPSQDHSSHSHSDVPSPERSNPVTHAHAHATATTPCHPPPTDLHPAKIPTPPGAATLMAQWEARQHEILMRENGEFWEEIEQLREEIDRLRAGGEEGPVTA